MKIVAVAGAAECEGVISQVAYQVGQLAASKGFLVLTGGLAGVMKHALHGAKDAGGLTIGMIPSYDKSTANEYCDAVIPTGLGHGRNILVASSGDLCVSVGGSLGTASEIAIAKKLGREVVSFQSPIEHETSYDDRESFFIKLKELLERI